MAPVRPVSVRAAWPRARSPSPNLLQRRHNPAVILRWPRGPSPDHPRLQRLLQRPAGVVAVERSHRAHQVQDLRLPSPRWRQVAHGPGPHNELRPSPGSGRRPLPCGNTGRADRGLEPAASSFQTGAGHYRAAEHARRRSLSVPFGDPAQQERPSPFLVRASGLREYWSG